MSELCSFHSDTMFSDCMFGKMPGSRGLSISFGRCSWNYLLGCHHHMSFLPEINFSGLSSEIPIPNRHLAQGQTVKTGPLEKELWAKAERMEVYIFLSLFSFCLSMSSAFYFHVAERQEKCIIEDIPSNTWISGIYKIEQWDIKHQDFLDSAKGLGLFVTVTTHNDEVLLSRLYGSQGAFTFTSYSPGEHIICLKSNSTNLISFGGSKLRIHLGIRVGEHDLHAAIAQAKDKVNKVSSRLEHLTEEIEQIIKEQNYQREREENFRMISEDTNSNVLWWALAQMLLLILVGIFQMKSLKDFFIAKKLV
ncbi:transmembrane emp24 domain-containing protein 11-like [Phascolarctos cinereus]